MTLSPSRPMSAPRCSRCRRPEWKANFFLFSEHGYPPYGGILIARPDTIAERKAAMAKFVRASMEGWVSYLKDPAPGNALIKQDNPKMTDDLLAWGVTQIREHHLIDGGGCRQPGLGGR
ncbi:hydroxymethylpyrimidine ABC transporter substrate-binding protein [Klebsiella pneumoniae]|uniref:Hydroxymethylpyrimidine ABC transporter substrate-binding protein n=1 Tax=Klebsiella pneumoniae TaxID=573 RepID=A0A2X3EGI1_KLEPN|nr:hydroxymethylpyrimidine ABC transporter substrate-binding protein [Klebsiella pneumoniae]